MKTTLRQNTRSKRYLLCERAYIQLKNAVIKGKLKADQRLVETRLAGIMGISRTPVREAIHKLEQEGFVYKLSTGGYAVNPTTEKHVREIRGVAGILLGYAVYLATSSATENDLNLLRTIVKQAETYPGNGNRQVLFNVCVRFCDTLLLLSGNSQLSASFNGLKDHALWQLADVRDARKKHLLLNDQRTLIDLMEARQAARAEHLARIILLGKNDISEGHQDISESSDPID